MSEKWLAIDPGIITSGWAIFENSQFLEAKSGSSGELEKLILNNKFELAVIEASRNLPLRAGKWLELWRIIGRLEMLLNLIDARVIFQHPACKHQIVLPEDIRKLKLDRHARDAIKIGMWQLKFGRK